MTENDWEKVLCRKISWLRDFFCEIWDKAAHGSINNWNIDNLSLPSHIRRMLQKRWTVSFPLKVIKRRAVNRLLLIGGGIVFFLKEK